MHYTLTADTFVGECLEQIHAPSDDPAAYADQTLPVEHFERASCEPHQWFDYYFPVTAHMVDVEDNIVFEVETLAEQRGGVLETALHPPVEDRGAPSASMGHLKAWGSPIRPRAPAQPLGGLRRPSQLAAARS